MKQVTKEEFFNPIYRDKLDVHPQIISDYPYTSLWRFQKTLNRAVYGKTVDREEGGLNKTSYFLAEASQGESK